RVDAHGAAGAERDGEPSPVLRPGLQRIDLSARDGGDQRISVVGYRIRVGFRIGLFELLQALPVEIPRVARSRGSKGILEEPLRLGAGGGGHGEAGRGARRASTVRGGVRRARCANTCPLYLRRRELAWLRSTGSRRVRTRRRRDEGRRSQTRTTRSDDGH